MTFHGNVNLGSVSGGMHYHAGPSDADASERARTPNAPGRRPRIFISHAHADADLAAALVDLLRGCLVGLRDDDVRCSSLAGAGLPPGASVDATLQRDLAAALVCIVVMTPAAGRSQYVRAEAGAAWGLRVPVIQITVGAQALDGPFSNLVQLNGTTEGAIWTLLERVAELVPGTATVRPSLAAAQVARFVAQAQDAAARHA